MKELKVISLENGVILSENLVKGSILPRTSAELERDVLIQNDTIVEGAIYARTEWRCGNTWCGVH